MMRDMIARTARAGSIHERAHLVNRPPVALP
jgi:hypothetical protein